MNAMRRGMTALAIALLTATSAVAQEKAPEQPSGRLLTDADHRQNVSQPNTFEWRNPFTKIEGITSTWPDGTTINSVKQADGSLRHNIGAWRIDGEKFCQTARTPNAQESCIRSYQTGDNEYQMWRNGTFAGYWRTRK
jgi:hypothetical protein